MGGSSRAALTVKLGADHERVPGSLGHLRIRTLLLASHPSSIAGHQGTVMSGDHAASLTITGSAGARPALTALVEFDD
jgi:hypothetical protein